MRLGIFGGTFDPIHLGHLLVAETAREVLQLQRVLFLPAGDPPLKQDVKKTPAHHRQAMVEQAIAANPYFELNCVDLQRPGPHYSTDTVQLIRSQYKLTADESFFIVGADSLISLPRWHNAAELISLCRLVVAHRPGYRPDLNSLESALPGLRQRVDWIETPLPGLEATQIRQRVQAGQSIRYWVCDEVRAYIEKHGLYQGGYNVIGNGGCKF